MQGCFLPIRKGALSPYSRDAEAKTLDLLEEAMLLKHPGKVNDTVIEQLLASAVRDVQELLPHLETRARECAADAENKLQERGEAEASAMRQILEDQRKHIESTAAKYEKYDPAQLRLDYEDAPDELRQLESNRKYWTARLISLERELESEPERVRAVYEIKATRIEPVGLAYLWPVSG